MKGFAAGSNRRRNGNSHPFHDTLRKALMRLDDREDGRQRPAHCQADRSSCGPPGRMMPVSLICDFYTSKQD